MYVTWYVSQGPEFRLPGFLCKSAKPSSDVLSPPGVGYWVSRKGKGVLTYQTFGDLIAGAWTQKGLRKDKRST